MRQLEVVRSFSFDSSVGVGSRFIIVMQTHLYYRLDLLFLIVNHLFEFLHLLIEYFLIDLLLHLQFF